MDPEVTSPQPAADIALPGDGTLFAALQLAVRAPSVHNSQPWRWRVGPRSVQLYADRSRLLPATDPDGRDLLISCGAALHHLLVALAALGRSGRVRRLPDPERPEHLATVELTPRSAADADTALADAITVRRTDRRRFRSWPVPGQFLGELIELADLAGLHLEVVMEPALRWKVVRAIRIAAEQQAADPAYAEELAAWSGRPPGSPDGVPTANAPSPARVPGQPPLRAFADPGLAQSTGDEPEDAALLVLSTPTDAPLQWLRAGEVTSAILLAAARDGLASSPFTQPLEVADTRAYLRSRIARVGHPQILLRIGWPSPGEPPPLTPRRPLADVVEPLDAGPTGTPTGTPIDEKEK
jgi:nitroreductase